MKKIDYARDFLKEVLSKGPMLADHVMARAEMESISSDRAGTLFRAKTDLGIKSQKGFNGQWWWFDPDVIMSTDMKKSWFERNKDWLKDNDIDDFEEEEEANTENYLSVVVNNSTGAKEVRSHYNNPYEWLFDNGIYYFNSSEPEQHLDEKEQWLIERLKDGPVLKSEVLEDALKLKYPPNQMEQIKKKLKFADIEGLDKKIWWSNPDRDLVVDKNYKELRRNDSREATLHKKEYKEFYGHSFYGESDNTFSKE